MKSLKTMRRSTAGIAPRTAQGGFTLIELFVVVLVLGIIAAFLIPAFTSGGSSNARAKAVITFTTQSQGIVRTAVSQMQLPYAVDGSAANNNMIETGQTWMDVLTYGVESPAGTSLVKPVFRARYGLTGAGHLREAMAMVPGGGEFDLTVQGYPISLTQAPAGACGADDGNARVWSFNFQNVPDDVVLAMATSMIDPEIQNLAVSDLTNRTMRYSAADANTGLRTVCILRDMG
ncbi:type II secretion system protein [Sinimarinibacterium sp. NLF-5-8]|uniref:type II secretion system protein n=1 Tax=Sinimarinibacterium sp. NLF-5-8 TaxID=2698684 RepID=UPI00137BC1D0|nr:type II secretion system protein [Sinimarinibacterium sp. NLF-5-8]QHS09128.1 type II secretion system protein [Sinimarinibacterium sp. NLF-5-8]